MKKYIAVIMMLLMSFLAASCDKPEGCPEIFDAVCTADNALASAKSYGAVVIEDLKCTSGKEIWDDFYKNVTAGKKASVLVAHYYTLDDTNISPELYEQEKDHYPCLYFCYVEYNGNDYYVKARDCSKTELDKEGNYKHLLHFEGPNTLPGSDVDISHDTYVLIDDDSVTWDKLMLSNYSSRLEDHYDHFNVYEDYKTEDQ